MVEESEEFVTITVSDDPDPGSGFLLADGFDDAFVGLAYRCGWSEPVAVYDYHKCLSLLELEGADESEAMEYFEYNVLGAWVGEQTPLFVIGARIPAILDTVDERRFPRPLTKSEERIAGLMCDD